MSEYSQDAARLFARFAPFIRERIYAKGWTQLREVQIGAARVIFDTEDDLIVTSATASGKTEAVFFPLLSLMEQARPQGFTVLYVAPLKALINDQFERMEELLEDTGLRVTRWHGEVSPAHKQRFLKDPGGILQITPESLQSLLINRSNDVGRLFCDLRFVVLDEIHTLPGRDRGEQTRCLLDCLDRMLGYSPRRIGLSATVGQPQLYAQWLGSGGGRRCSVVEIPQERIRWRLALEHFWTDSSPAELSVDGQPAPEQPAADAATDYVYRAVKNKKSIVFSNSREQTESITASLRQEAQRRREPDVFYIHHGNLSAALRQEAEQSLKESRTPAVACATVTLELGIDVGRLERIVQLESPNSVAGFLQRIGRSGRRENPAEMLMVFREETPVDGAPLYQQIPWQLIQAIAVVQLYLEERWVEPPEEKRFPVSLLFHQILCQVAGSGSLSLPRLAGRVLRQKAFRFVEPAQLSRLISHMVKQDLLSLDEQQHLLIGPKGERLVSGYTFYAVFSEAEEFTVRSASREIGTVANVPPVGDRFALAGRVWEVLEQDVSKRQVYVKEVPGKMEVSWPGDAGEIHSRILQRMHRVLREDTAYPYLCPNALRRLEQARHLARRTGILQAQPVCLGGNTFALFPWCGTRTLRTLKRFLVHRCTQALGLSSVQNANGYCLTFRMSHPDPSGFYPALFRELAGGVTAWDLVGESEYPLREKFDTHVGQHLALEAFCADRLNLEELRALVEKGLSTKEEPYV